MTKSLTEKWKDGELDEGLYYIEAGNEHDICVIRNRYCPILFSPYSEDNAFESEFVPVAPVPSYDESKKLQEQNVDLSQKVHILNEANEKNYNALCDEIKKNNKLQEQLNTATKALKGISVWANTGNGGEQAVKNLCEKALKEMGVK